MAKTYQNNSTSARMLGIIEKMEKRMEKNPQLYKDNGIDGTQELQRYFAAALHEHMVSLARGTSPFNGIRTPEDLLRVYPPERMTTVLPVRRSSKVTTGTEKMRTIREIPLNDKSRPYYGFSDR